MKAKIDVSVILPVHNQEKIITQVSQAVSKVLRIAKISYEILLIENGSTDQTLTVLKELVKKNPHLFVYVAPQGYGSAIIAGLQYVKGKYVAYMPSDGQLSPHLLPLLFSIISTNKYALVKIRRSDRESWIRFARSKIFNRLACLFLPIPSKINDINGSPRMFLRNQLSALDLKYKDSFIDTEMAVKAYYLRWKIKEIPTQNLPRLGGKSSVSYKTVIEFIKNIVLYKFSKEFRTWVYKHSI